MIQFIKDVLRLDQLRRRERRFLDACELMRLQVHTSPKAAKPENWSKLYDVLQPFEQD